MNKIMTGENIKYEPKKKNRFFVKFPERLGFETWHITKINRPKYVNGKWSNIEIEFIDAISPSVSVQLFHLQEFDELNEKLLEIHIFDLDPVGEEVSNWTIKAKILSIDFGDWDYSSDDIQRPKVLLNPSFCSFEYK